MGAPSLASRAIAAVRSAPHWKRGLTTTLRLVAVGAGLSLVTTVAWLWGGSAAGGIAIGAVTSFLVTLAFPRIIEKIRGEKFVTAPYDLRFLGESLAIIGLTLIFTVPAVRSLQLYAVQQVQALHTITLISPVPAGRYVLNSVEYDGQRYVAVGNYRPDGTGDRYMDAALWQSSDDGYSWSRLPHIPQLLGDIAIPNGHVAHREMEAVKITDNGLLILGSDTAPDGVQHGRVWRLRAGNDTVEAADDVQLPPASSYTSYQKHDSTEILTGFDAYNAMVWVRKGGGDWSARSFGASNVAFIRSVRFEHGKWILSGYNRATDPDYSSSKADDPNFYCRDAAIWISDDGVDWREANGLSGSKGSQVANDVRYIHGMWVAVGENDQGDPRGMDAAIWLSDDSTNWHRLEEPSIKGVPGWQSMAGAVPSADNSHLVVVGTEVPTSDSGVPTPSANGESPWRNAVWQMDFYPRTGWRNPMNIS